jgi:hypothetical protein
MTWKERLFWTLLYLLVMVMPVFGESRTFKPGDTHGKDAYITYPNLGNDGTALSVQKRTTDATYRRVLISFSNLDSLPAGITVTKVKLRLWQSTTIAADTIEVMKILTNWNESTVSWDTQPQFDSTNLKFTWNTGFTGSINGVDSTESDSLKNWVQRWANGLDNNYGILIRYSNEKTDDKAHNWRSSSNSFSSDYRPELYVEYTINSVYTATELNWGTTTDSTSKLLNIILPAAADTTNTNRYAIRHVQTGYWIQPADSSDNLFNKNRQAYIYSVLKNLTIPLVNNYEHSFEVQSDTTGSYKSATFTHLKGVASGANRGRWNPAIDKIE